MVSKEELIQVAELCKLKFSDEELEDFATEFSKTLNRLDILKEVDTEGIEPTNFITAKVQPLREELAWESLPREEVLKNAPEEQYGYFKLLRVMD